MKSRALTSRMGVVFLMGLMTSLGPAASTPPRTTGPWMSVRVDLGQLRIHERAAIPLTVHMDARNENLMGQDWCIVVGGRFLRPDESDPSLLPTPFELGSSDWIDGRRLGVTWIRFVSGKIRKIGETSYTFNAGPGSAPLVAPPGTGRLLLVVLAGHSPCAYDTNTAYESMAQTKVDVIPEEKKLEILPLDVPDGTTVKVGKPFDIRLEFVMKDGGGGNEKTDVTIKGTLRRGSADPSKPGTSITRTGTMKVPVPDIGCSINSVKEFRGLLTTPGECELEVEVSAPGYPTARRSIRLKAVGETGTAPAAPVVKPGKTPFYRSAAPTYFYDNAEHAEAPSRSGPYWQMTFSPTTMAYSERAPDESGKERMFSGSVKWTEPPPVIYNDEEFPLSISASPKGGAHVMGVIHASRGDFIFSNPYTGCSNFEGPEKEQIAIQVKPSISESSDEIMLSFSATPRRYNSDSSVYGAFVQWRYSREAPTEMPATGESGGSGAGANALDFSGPETAPLEAWLEPATVEVSPRSGVYSSVDLRIRGVKPNGNDVEVKFATTDGRGTLDMEKHLKVEGSGRRQTGDMWNDNQGSFRWGLNVGANLGIMPGDYQLPITVDQPGHGRVQLALNIRVIPRVGASPAPAGSTRPPVSSGQAGKMEACLELPSLDVHAGGQSALSTVFVRGADTTSGQPIEILFPQMAQDGALPGGIVVNPGTTKSLPSDKWPVDVEQQGGWLPFAQAFYAKSDAPAGITMVDMIVRQRGRGDIPLRLQVAVLRRSAPVSPVGARPPPPIQPGPITARLDRSSITLRPGEFAQQVTLRYRGWRGDVPDRVEVQIPQADPNGNTPEGLIVFPPSFSRSPADVWRDTPLEEAVQGFSISARGNARPGTNTLFFRVRQGRYGEAVVPLTVIVAGRGASSPPSVSPSPPTPPMPTPTGNVQASPEIAQGQALLAANNWSGALAVFNQILQANPAQEDALCGRATARFWTNDLDGAAADYRAVVRAQPDNQTVRRLLIVALVLQGRGDDADDELTLLQGKLGPDAERDVEYLLLRGQAEMVLGMGGQADATFRQVMKLAPGRVDLLYNQSVEMLQRGQFNAGAFELETLLRMNPAYANAWWALGDARERLGRKDGAIEAFRSYLRLVPTGAWADAARQRTAALSGGSAAAAP